MRLLVIINISMAITDKAFCALTAFLLIVYLGLLGASIGMANPEQLTHPYDMNGFMCKDSFIYFLTPQEGYLDRTVCLKSCPKAEDTKLDCVSPNIKCTINNNPTNPSEQVRVYGTAEYHRFACLPTDYKLFNVVLSQLEKPKLQSIAVSLKEDVISIAYVFSLALTIGFLIQTYQHRYYQLIMFVLRKMYPLAVFFILLILINSFSIYSRATIIQQLGQKRPLISSGMEALILSTFEKYSHFGLFACFSLLFILGMADVILNPANSKFPHNEQFIKLRLWNLIKYTFQPLWLSCLHLVNFLILYLSIPHAISIGQPAHGFIYFQGSPLTLVFLSIQLSLFAYFSILLCLSADSIVFYNSMGYFKEPRALLQGQQLLKRVLSHVGSISKFAWLLIFYSPKSCLKDFFGLIRNQRAERYALDFYTLRTTILGFVLERENEDLTTVRDNLAGLEIEHVQQQQDEEKRRVVSYYDGCCKVLRNGALFNIFLLITLQLILKVNLSSAILIALMGQTVSYLFTIQLAKGACAMQNLRQMFDNIDQQEQNPQDQIARMNILMVTLHKQILRDQNLKQIKAAMATNYSNYHYYMKNLSNSYQFNAFGQFSEWKIENKFRASMYTGTQFYPCSLPLFLYFFNSYLDYLLLAITIALWCFRGNRQWPLIAARILLGIVFLSEKDQIRSAFFGFVASALLIADWRLQVLSLLSSIRGLSNLYILLFYIALSRGVQILKRTVFGYADDKQKRYQQQMTLLKQLPQHILILDEDSQILFSNHDWVTLKFTAKSKEAITDAIRKRASKHLILDHQERVSFEYLFRNYFGKYYLVQLQFGVNPINLFEKLEKSSQVLYCQLCQDYQKWNNLRAFKVIKESDLSQLGHCASSCRFLQHQLKTIDYLMKDISFTQDSESVQYHLKNYLVNIVESLANQLFDYFTIIDLEFEHSVPDFVSGNKNCITYIIYTLLYSATMMHPNIVKQKNQPKLEEKLIKIKVTMLRVNNEKFSYDLQFTLEIPCNPKQIQMYTSMIKQTDFVPQTETHQLVMYMLNKSKQLVKQAEQDFSLKAGLDQVVIFFTQSVRIASAQSLETTNIAINSDQSIQNILVVDLSFTRVLTEKDHFQWKAKSQTAQKIVPLRFEKPPSENSEQLEQTPKNINLEFPEIKQKVVELIEELIRQAHAQGMFDKESVKLHQLENDRAQSEQVDTEQLDSLVLSPKLYQTPQPKPRRLPKTAQPPQQLFIQKRSPIMESLKPKYRDDRQKKLSLLFSPNLISQFANNLVSGPRQNLKHSNFAFGASLNSLNEIEDSRNQSFQDRHMFSSFVFKHLVNPEKRVWSHKVEPKKLPERTNKVLCYFPDTRFSDYPVVFMNSTYCGYHLSTYEVVYDIYEGIELYKQMMEEGLQYCFILIYVHKQNEVIDFTNTVKNIEKQLASTYPQLKQTQIIGVTDKSSNLSIQIHFNHVLPTLIPSNDIIHQKNRIVSLLEGK